MGGRRLGAMETIFALATPPGHSAVALMRVSGPTCALASRVLGVGEMAPRRSVRVELPLDVGSVPAMIWLMPGPRSFTGDDVIEFLLPGNPWAVLALERKLQDLGFRPAEPGEFTRRAFESGRLDLAQAEATLALVTAGDERGRRQAAEELSGQAGRALTALTERLRALSARFELAMDFSEDEQEQAEEGALPAEARALLADLEAFAGAPPALPAGTVPRAALFGPPNAGKSSLFNALLGEPRALVTPLAGTTRDPVPARFKLPSGELELCDLSGVGETDADAGRFALAARERALAADILLLLCAPGQEQALLREFAALGARDPALRARALWVWTMIDLAEPPEANPAGLPQEAVSAASGRGLEGLRERLATRASEVASGGVLSRMRLLAREAVGDLREAAESLESAPLEVAAGCVRRALRRLDEARLAETPGEVLDLIFSRFCIGK